MIRRVLLYKAAVLIVILICAAPGLARAELEESARAFVRDLAKTAVQSLAVKDISRDERIKRFREMFRTNFMVKSIGKAALGSITRGQSWKAADEAKQATYFQVFEDYVVNSYVDLFARYAGEQLQVTDVRTENAQILTVFSKVQRPGGVKPIRIHWLLATNGKIFKVLDIFAEGPSMSKTFAVNFRTIYGNEGRSLDGLIGGIRKEIAKLSSEPAK